jgi:adenylosuccinate synthase
LDNGTYPFVTSSHPVAGGACLGTGVGPRAIQNILGVAKAYTTRVGSGPFPTEQDNAIGQQIRDQGHEYGTVTGRGRRCGWLDLVALKHACRLNSLSGLVMTRLDVLANVGDLQMATGYAGRTGFPANVWDLAEVTPEYVTMPGWTEDLRGCRHYNDLPSTVHRYLEFIEEYTETPVAVISIGPDRKETIVKRPDLIWGA